MSETNEEELKRLREELTDLQERLNAISADAPPTTVSPDEPGEIEMPPYTLVYSGEHEITVTYEKED